MQKTNFEHLLDLIKDNEEAVDFANSVKDDYDKLITDLEDKNNSLESDIQDLKTEIQNAGDDFEGKDIDCGVGAISYQTSGSMDLDSIMEALEERIKKDGFKSVLRLLEYDQIPA